jgi:hypothetical protein
LIKEILSLNLKEEGIKKISEKLLKLFGLNLGDKCEYKDTKSISKIFIK